MSFTKKMEDEILRVLKRPVEDVLEWLRPGLETLINIAMKIEADRLAWEDREKMTRKRVDYRAGYYRYNLYTRFGWLAIAEPRLRETPFVSRIFDGFKEHDEKIKKMVVSMSFEGVSHRGIKGIMEEFLGHSFSPAKVSQICREAYGELEVWRTRPLAGPCPIVMLDALYLYCRSGDEPVNKSGKKVGKNAVFVALGVDGRGHRHVLGVDIGPWEKEESWAAFIAGLKERGLSGTLLTLGDGHPGLRAALKKELPASQFQSCAVHLERSVLQKTQCHLRKALAEPLKAIFKQSGEEGARKAAQKVMEWLEDKGQEKARNALENGLEMALTYYQFPQTLWRQIYTNNLAERVNREIKRRTKAVGSFTDSCSALMMVCARLRRINRQWEEEEELYMEGVDGLEAEEIQRTEIFLN